MTHSPLRTRYAPTPSGFLHRGNVTNFLLAWALARSRDGEILLRIDDLDAPRVRPAYLADVFSTLRRFQLDYDLGPSDETDLADGWSQRHRLETYALYLERLRATGLVYACDCSRRQIRERSTNGLYPGTCRHRGMPLDQPGLAWRIRVDEQCAVSPPEAFKRPVAPVQLAAEMGDFVVRKKDGTPAYQLASLVDDLEFGVTELVRGRDLLASTAAQLFLAETLGEVEWRNRVRCYHHPLLTEVNGEKLSKSAGAAAVNQPSEIGATRSAIIAQVRDWLREETDPALRAAWRYLGGERG